MPLVNNLCDTREESFDCKTYPLKVQLFTKSDLSSITETVPREELFVKYLYKSGVSKPYMEHCADMYHYIDSLVKISPHNIIVDIGGNDGTLLYEFDKQSPYELRLINVDPCIEFKDENQQKHIEFIGSFFNRDMVFDSKADIIVSTNVFQHNVDVNSFVCGVSRNLSNKGIWCLEFPYWFTTMLTDNYDQVYHEHVYYYTLNNIIDLVRKHDMQVLNVSYHDIHAGTLRCIITHDNNSMSIDGTVSSFLNIEKLLTDQYYRRWGELIRLKIGECANYITRIKENGNVIFGFGAAAKGCTFLNSCGLTNWEIPYVIDDTSEKQGKFIPGTGIEIVGRDILKRTTPTYILILAHNFKDYIIKTLTESGYTGKFLVMFPTIQVI
jgi:mRNA-degrading endonuclease HigB of HigAB toxin-antitoxin module